MFILTGSSGSYSDYSMDVIAVSESREKLEEYQAKINAAQAKKQAWRQITYDYQNRKERKDREAALPLKPHLSKDHLPMTEGKKRFEINRANAQIDRENWAKLSALRAEIAKEAEEIARIQIPMSPEEETLGNMIHDAFSIDEVLVL